MGGCIGRDEAGSSVRTTLRGGQLEDGAGDSCGSGWVRTGTDEEAGSTWDSTFGGRGNDLLAAGDEGDEFLRSADAGFFSSRLGLLGFCSSAGVGCGSGIRIEPRSTELGLPSIGSGEATRGGVVESDTLTGLGS